MKKYPYEKKFYKHDSGLLLQSLQGGILHSKLPLSPPLRKINCRPHVPQHKKIHAKDVLAAVHHSRCNLHCVPNQQLVEASTSSESTCIQKAILKFLIYSHIRYVTKIRARIALQILPKGRRLVMCAVKTGRSIETGSDEKSRSWTLSSSGYRFGAVPSRGVSVGSYGRLPRQQQHVWHVQNVKGKLPGLLVVPMVSRLQ